MKSKYFGNININDVEDCYECELEHNGKTLYPLVTFEKAVFSNRKIKESDVLAADKLVDKLDTFIAHAIKPLDDSFKNKSTVYEYLEHHLDEMPGSELSALGIDCDTSHSEKIKHLKQCLHFKSVILDPTNETDTLTLDYTISEEYTQYVLAVRINARGELSDIYMES